MNTLGLPMFFALLAAGCGNSAMARICVPGQQVACACPGGLSGAQVCNDQGSGLGACFGCGAGDDLGVSASDFAAPPSDLATLDPDVTTAHGDFHKFVFSSMTLPTSHSEFAIDLNGDGIPDNQLGSLVSALSARGINSQDALDKSLTAGNLIELLAFQTSDQTLQNDLTAGVTLEGGKTQAMPDFSGKGTFTVDGVKTTATLYGHLIGGKFSSNNPVTTLFPVAMTLRCSLLFVTVNLPIKGAHIQFTSTHGAITSGEIQGSILANDLQTKVIPSIALGLNARVASDPGSVTAKQILTLFDTGNCLNLDGSMAKAKDRHIDTCEVADSAILKSQLLPDVQIYDDLGSYAPNPANTTKDSLSVGIAFTAVPASF